VVATVNEQDVPVYWDGGYWYIVPCEFPKPNHRRPAAVPAQWTATYGIVGGVDYALIRTPDLWLNAPAVPVTQDEVLAAAKSQEQMPTDLIGKPGMRIGGR
jgi:hypothetical protein